MEQRQMERRKSRRYPIECPVRFRLLGGGKPSETGQGTTLNMASRGLLVATDQLLPEGASVELAVEWPARLNARTGLRLIIQGSVLRSGEGKLAVLIRKHEFRLAGSSSLTPAQPHY